MAEFEPLESEFSPMVKEASKVLKRFQDYEQNKQQMSLFELVTTEDSKYSNTVELYDFMPKYFWGKTNRTKMEIGTTKKEVLLPLERKFEFRGKKYQLIVTPATIIDTDGTIRDYYPSEREEFIEEALRKLACEGQGFFLDEQAGVKYTLYELYKELHRVGHTLSINQIKHSLLVCKMASIQVTSEDGQNIVVSNIFETLGLRTWDDWKEHGKNSIAFVRFNPLVTQCIKDRSFRRVNYEKVMSYKSVIARQLHKRMSHLFVQASIVNTYTFMLSTIMRDFGLTQYADLRNNLRDLIYALEELKGEIKKTKKEVTEKEQEANKTTLNEETEIPKKKPRQNPLEPLMKKFIVVLSYQIEKIVDPKKGNKLIDAKVTLKTHPRFNSDAIRANEIHRKIISAPSS